MKIRNGFVSNSSSSSFVIYKKGLTKEQLKIIDGWLKTNVWNNYNYTEGKASWYGEAFEGIQDDLAEFLEDNNIHVKSDYTEFNL